MITLSEHRFSHGARDTVERCLRSGWISRGWYAREFGAEIAKACNVAWAIPTITGTAALELAIRVGLYGIADIRIPTLTFVATGNALLSQGKFLIFADIQTPWRPDLRELIGRMDGREHVIADAAPCVGMDLSCYRLSILSFNGNKPITTGQGGAILGTNDNDREVVEDLLRLRKIDGSYKCNGLGYNYGMPDLNASIGLDQIRHIDYHISERARVIGAYRSAGLDMLESRWTAICILPDDVSRDRAVLSMAEKGVETKGFWYPLHLMPHFRRFPSHPCPVATALHERLLMLPCYSGLTDKQIKEVVKACRESFA